MTDIDLVAALIQTNLPHLAEMEVVLLGEGTDHLVYEVGGMWLLRIPRDQEAGAALEVEAKVLRWLAPQLPLPVPAYELVGAGGASSRKLTGTPAIRSQPQGSAPGARLGTFLRALHDTDAERAAELGVPPDDDPTLTAWAEAALDDLEFAATHDLFTPDFRIGLHHRLVAPPLPPPLPPRLIHGDFAAEHVLLDAAGEPCGVIDWSDLILGDVAQDLGGLLHWGGSALLRAAQETYGPITDSTLERARFYASCRALADLTYGHTEGRPEYIQAGQRALSWLFAER